MHIIWTLILILISCISCASPGRRVFLFIFPQRLQSDGRLNELLCLQVIRMVGESQEAVGVGAGTGPSSNKMPTLEEYGTNLTTQATEVASHSFSALHPSFCSHKLIISSSGHTCADLHHQFDHSNKDSVTFVQI